MKKTIQFRLFTFVIGAFLLLPAVARAQSKAVILDDIVARVNNRIISLSDYQKASQELAQEVQQDCQNCTPEKEQQELKGRQKNLLRDMIDQQLLIERAKDMNIDVETDLVKRLDQIRKQNNLPTMDALQKAVEAQGLDWEDYKSQIRDNLLTQKVIQREVSGQIDIGSDEVKQYYDAHKQEFVRPEEVSLAEIFLSTQGKTADQIAAIRAQADQIHTRLVNGEDFAALAKRYSKGSTADQGGNLGNYQRGQLAPQLEAIVFKMDKGQITAPIRTQTGFEILKVLAHYQAGLQPLANVEDEITNKLFQKKMQPALRAYLAQLREESYVKVRPGYTDTAAVTGATAIEEVPPTPDTPQKKGKKRLRLPKVNG